MSQGKKYLPRIQEATLGQEYENVYTLALGPVNLGFEVLFYTNEATQSTFLVPIRSETLCNQLCSFILKKVCF